MEGGSNVRDFSKYFTPPLTSEDRQRLAHALRLGENPWVLEESCGGQVLRRWSSTEGPSWGRRENGFHEFDFAALGPQLHCVPFRESRELWRELLPHPFRSVADSSPSAAGLAQVWASMEAALSAFELSLVWVGEASSGVPLLFHFVRRRCIRLGTTESLQEIGQKCLSGEWSPHELQGHFGTRTGFFHWEASEGPGHPLDRFAEILRKSFPEAVLGLSPAADGPRTML